MSDSAPQTDIRDLSVEVARARILADLPTVVAETATLDEALGRVLAENIIAQRSQPPFDASAMDGWAVCGPGERFIIVGESAAGHGYPAAMSQVQAVRIFTGAPVPTGADRVVIQEQAQRDGEALHVPPAGDGPSYIRAAGGDFAAGERLLQAGMRLDPWRIALAAAAGRAQLSVARRPRVAVLATGEELAAAGEEPRSDQIFDSGGPALSGLIRLWGGEPLKLRSTGDDLEAIADAVAQAGGDVVVTLGGASVGDHDLVKPALARLGLTLQVENVRLRPGKPTWYGVLADGRRVVGLPGNPASGLVCAQLFLRPLLLGLQGAGTEPALATARLATTMAANGPREHWARGRLAILDGVLMAQPMSDQDSSLVSVFAQADVLIRRPPGAPAAAAGDTVSILRLERL